MKGKPKPAPKFSVSAYCVTCKKKKNTSKVNEAREMANGATMLFLSCPTCGTTMTTMAKKGTVFPKDLKVKPHTEKAPNTNKKKNKAAPSPKQDVVAFIAKQLKDPLNNAYAYMATGGDLTLYVLDDPNREDGYLLVTVNESKAITKENCQVINYSNLGEAYHQMVGEARKRL